MTYQVRHISISIECPMEDVYRFASNPENLPQWAEGLSRSSIKKSGEDWIADSPMGVVKVRFVEENNFGVMDHFVTFPSGEVFYNPMRVIGNSNGSEVLFTLFRLPTMSESEFERDAGMVQDDLLRLKSLLEKARS